MKKPDPTLAGNIKGDFLGRRLRAARERLGLSRKDAANAYGLTDKHLGRIERGGVEMVSDASTLVRAAKALGVSSVWLYAGGMAGRLVPDWYDVPKQEQAA